MQRGAEGQPLEMLGMAEESMYAYLETLIEERARASAEARGISLENELEFPIYAANRAAVSYAIKIMVANNAYLTRHLLELGVIQPGAGVDLQDDER